LPKGNQTCQRAIKQFWHYCQYLNCQRATKHFWDNCCDKQCDIKCRFLNCRRATKHAKGRSNGFDVTVII
jgi:hypothetical protein